MAEDLGNTTLTSGTVFDIANSSAAGISAFFAGQPDGSGLAIGTNKYIINYGTAVADEITLTAAAIPEPGAWAMILSGAASLLVYQRTRGLTGNTAVQLKPGSNRLNRTPGANSGWGSAWGRAKYGSRRGIKNAAAASHFQ